MMFFKDSFKQILKIFLRISNIKKLNKYGFLRIFKVLLKIFKDFFQIKGFKYILIIFKCVF